jgi:Universal stress protein family
LVDQARLLASDKRPIEVVLLNVQPEPTDGRLRGYGSFKRAEIKTRLTDCLGRRAVTAAGRVLSRAGIEHVQRVEIGDTVETVLRVAHEEHCGLIVVGNPVPGRVQKWLQRSLGLLLPTLGCKIAQLSEVPVFVVK